MIRPFSENNFIAACFVLSIPCFSQEIAISDTTLPFKVGPLINQLPSLDSLEAVSNDSTKYLSIPSKENYSNQYPLNASGSFFRGLELGGNGNNTLNGGLRMQIAGKISDETFISGVVTDETLPIQPDGSTADLDELDKVFIQIDNPKFSIVAGDIETHEEHVSINKFERKLIGLDNKIEFNDRVIRSVIGQSKGTYQRLEIKGQDGNQGPYYLTTVDGLSNTVVSSGSEKVWLNGVLLKRGEDLDYTIDYSKGEVYFTSKNLIYFDSDIDIEYLYRQTNFATNYLETGIEGSIFNDSDFQLRYIRENQNIHSSFLNEAQKNQFNQSNEITIEGIYEDSLGGYILENGIYIFAQQSENAQRYSVVFSPDKNGNYLRKVSDKNRIFYEYSNEIKLGEQRFEPGQTVSAPIGKNILQFNSRINTTNSSSFILESVLSMKNNNLYNRENNHASGSAFRLGYIQDNISLRGLNLGFDIEHLVNSKNFNSLGRDRAVDFNETWDIDPLTGASEIAISKLGAELKSDHTQIEFDLFDLKGSNDKKSRNEIKLKHKSSFVKKGNFRYNRINGLQKFDQLNSKFVFLSGAINPFVNVRHEHRNEGYRFDDVLTGVGVTKNKRSLSFGIGKRNDWDYNDGRQAMSLTKNSEFIELDYKFFDPKGWRHEIVVRSRTQTNSLNKESSSFGSGRLAINYRKKMSPLRINSIFNIQNSVKEYASVIYDSVGIGRGNFRYDTILNEYIRDDNGSFIANTILLGSYKAGKNINSISRMAYDFSKSKLKILKFIKYRYTNNINYHGPESNIFDALNNKEPQLLMLNNRNEIIFQKNSTSTRHRFSIESRINFNGMDLRGWQDKRSEIFRVDSQIPLTDNYFLKYDLNIHTYSLSTSNNFTLSRDVEGFYHELGLKKSSLKNFQYEVKAIYYNDNAVSELFDKNVYAYGLKGNFIRFINNNGRIDGRVDYYEAKGFEGMPAEALKGISSNKTLRANITSSLMIDQSLSFNTTIMYTDSERYDGFFQITGELRAYF